MTRFRSIRPPGLLGNVQLSQRTVSGPGLENALDPFLSAESREYLEGRRATGDASENFESVVGNAADELREKARRSRSSLTRHERRFLSDFCRVALHHDEIKINGIIYDSYTAYDVFRLLHDFDGLRQYLEVAVRPGEDYYYGECAAAFLEDFHRAAGHYRFISGVHDQGAFEENISRAHSAMHRDLLKRYSYDKSAMFAVLPTASALLTLALFYDVFISIPRGGLFSGGIARLLGFDTRFVEIHAHGRVEPSIRFLDEVKPEDVAGKRVLFLDKDAVHGSTMQVAHELFGAMGAASMGVYFNYPPGVTNPKAIKKLRELGLAVYHHENVNVKKSQREPILLTFYRLHERLKTPLGRMERTLKTFWDMLYGKEDVPEEARTSIQREMLRREELYFALNHHLPGMEEVRERIVAQLESGLRAYNEFRTVAAMTGVSPFTRVAELMSLSQAMPLDAAEILAMGRYKDRGKRLVEEYGVTNKHFPHNFTASFAAARRAVADNYDVALIVGPEGFMYQPMFEDLGLETVAINIPEADFGGDRSIKVFDDLSALAGKRVLVVEDDVQSGATLEKVLQALSDHQPSNLGLYLGSQIAFQMLENVPPAFEQTYVTEPSDIAKNDSAFLEHLMDREVFYKRPLDFDPFKNSIKD